MCFAFLVIKRICWTLTRSSAVFTVRDLGLSLNYRNLLKFRQRTAGKIPTSPPYLVLWNKNHFGSWNWSRCVKSFELQNWCECAELLAFEFWKWFTECSMHLQPLFHSYLQEPDYHRLAAPVTRIRKDISGDMKTLSPNEVLLFCTQCILSTSCKAIKSWSYLCSICRHYAVQGFQNQSFLMLSHCIDDMDILLH